MKNQLCPPGKLNGNVTRDLDQLSLKAYATFVNEQILGKNDPTEDDNYQYLLIIEGETDQHIIYLQDKLYEIGRRHNAQITIKDQSVSRYHASIIKEFNQEKNLFFYKILDGSLSGKKSKNGLTINDKNYPSKYLEHGDLISFSQDTKARFFVVDKNSTNDNLFVDINHQEEAEHRAENYGKQTLTADVESVESNYLHLQTDHVIEYISKLSSLAELSPYPIIEINLQGKLTYHNPSAALLFPNLKKETMSHPLLSDLLKAEHKIQGNLFVREVNYEDKIFEQYIHYLPELKLIRSYIFDFTKRKKIESRLIDSEAKYRAVVENTSEGILLFNADDLQIIEANLSATRILNYSLKEITGESIDFFLLNKHADFKNRLKLLKQTELSFRDEFKFKVKYNQPIDVELSADIIDYDNKLVFCCVFRDITRRKKLESKLKYQAYYDSLTGLYKRSYFRKFFSKILINHKHNNLPLAIMFLDIDKFKQINDRYGHDVGDLLLKQFAQRLKNCVKQDDCLARWGGDEFTVLLAGIITYSQIISISERIIKSMNSPFVCNGITVKTSTSIGIAIFPSHGNTVDSLMKKADQALYTTKQGGRNGYTIYS